MYLDEVWNYGFSKNIADGLIPYKDFNMVVTPLFPLCAGFFLKVFGSSILVLHIFNAFILVGIFYIIDSLLKDKNKFFIVFFFFFFPKAITYPSYNLFLLFLFLLLFALEETGENDYLVGFIIGLMIFTKQSVGVLLILPTFIYYFRDKKKILKRAIGCLIPCLLFLMFFIRHSCFSDFINFCLLGLFDFSNNGTRNGLFLYSSFILLLFVIKNIIREKKIGFCYLLLFYSIIIPLFDIYHFMLYVVAFLVIFFYYSKKKFKINWVMVSSLLVIGISFITFYYRTNFKFSFPNDVKYFEYRLLDNNYLNFIDEVSNKYQEYKEEKDIFFVGADAYLFKIINDEKISFIDLINIGNLGKDGSNKLLKYVKKKKNKYYFFVDRTEMTGFNQMDKQLMKYIELHAKKIDSVDKYDIYTF